MSLLEPILIGLLVGLVVGALGAGGGILSVPILVYALQQPPHSAAASSLVIVGFTAMTGLIFPVRERLVPWGRALAFGGVTVAGSLVGSRLSLLVDGSSLMLLFGVLLAAVAVAMLAQGIADRRAEARGDEKDADLTLPPPSTRLWVSTVGVGLLTGLLTGFFGVGGGFLMVPLLVLVLRVPMRRATAMSLVAMVLASLAGLAGRLGTDVTLDWPLTLLFTAGSALGGLAGGPLAARARPSTLTFAFAALLAAVAAVTLINTLGGASL
ncbi:MAG: sulfite exporter TauE/SafE family protein [Propioniciclava sp.]